MSRPKRELRKKFVVFCEGDTEYNYIDAMRLKQGVELALKPINMQGGGYASFLEEIRKEASNNCLAKFIIIDFDRAKKHPGERPKLMELIEYCKLQNSSKKIPHFLILNNPDFEYIACLHIESYHGQDVKRYIEQTLGFGSIERFKSMREVYSYLNAKGNSYKRMLDGLREKIVVNHYRINKTSFEIKISHTDIMWEHESERGSNINELYEVIDW
ncbi:MAG: RloB domain-containing protein [Lachnospiraceae bacterium]|nr:RloB domain-containing protein [Lachnospiraceae bacterium]